MKQIFHNTGLVLVLMGIFAVPLMGFGFISQGKVIDSASVNPNVLGASTLPKPSARKIDNTHVVTQLEYTVVINPDSDESVLYDVIPSDYSSYKNFIVTIPNELKDEGVTARIVVNENSVDLIVSAEKSSRANEIPATILVLN